MSIVIIGSLSKEVVRLHRYFSKVGITDIQNFMTVEDALDRLSDFSKTEIDLIIFDVIFTYKNGAEICRNIEILNGAVNVPILLSTSYDKTNTIEKAFDAGIFDFIPKPFNFTHFKARVHAALKYREETKLRKYRESNLQQDLSIAKKVQKNALTPALHLEHVQFDGLHVTSHTLGGDMYCWFKINEDLTAVMLYDVMGHGVAASLVTMSIRSLLRGMITRLIDPVFVINELNRHIYELFADDKDMDSFLVTAIYILIDTKSGTLHYVNASHPSGFLFGKYAETIMLPANTPILGLFPTIQVNKRTLKIAEWSRVILYTDGLITLNHNKPVDVEQFYPYIYQENANALENFSQSHDLFENYYSDDITIVSMTITL